MIGRDGSSLEDDARRDENPKSKHTKARARSKAPLCLRNGLREIKARPLLSGRDTAVARTKFRSFIKSASRLPADQINHKVNHHRINRSTMSADESKSVVTVVGGESIQRVVGLTRSFRRFVRECVDASTTRARDVCSSFVDLPSMMCTHTHMRWCYSSRRRNPAHAPVPSASAMIISGLEGPPPRGVLVRRSGARGTPM